jgi:uncharacterized protein (TIGR03435 family)
MKKAFWLMPLLALVVSQGHCQQVFEVASITPCAPGTPAPPGEHMGMVQFLYPGGRFTARATTVKYLMEWAYGILPAQHSEGPSWLGLERYDIMAKAPGNPTEEQMKLMTQALLEERFKLKIHRETKEVPILVLSVGKTPPKLFPPKEGETHSLKVTPKMGDDGKPSSWHTVATRYSFAQLNLVFATVLDRVIVNRTGLDGEYDFALDFTPDENRPNPMDPSLIISAMREQLGLVVKAEKGPAEFLVIENAERVAAGN